MDTREFRDVPGRTVFGRDGEKIGKAGSLYVDDETGAPEWVTVNTGLFGMRESFVPLRDASLRGDDLLVPFDKDTVKDAPNVADDGHLSVNEEAELYRHYGRDYDRSRYSDTDLTGREGMDTEAHQRRVLDGYEDAMTPSEERLRLRKYVDTGLH